MSTYIITAFSFLASSLGWFGGTPQTEVFFWAQIIASSAIVIFAIVAMMTDAIVYDRTYRLLGGICGVSLLATIFYVIGLGIILLVSWICTQLWALDFFLAFQIIMIGYATGGMFLSNKKN